MQYKITEFTDVDMLELVECKTLRDKAKFILDRHQSAIDSAQGFRDLIPKYFKISLDSIESITRQGRALIKNNKHLYRPSAVATVQTAQQQEAMRQGYGGQIYG